MRRPAYRLTTRSRLAWLDGCGPSLVPVVRVTRARLPGGGERYAVCQCSPTLNVFDLGGETRAVTLAISSAAVHTLCARDGIKTAPCSPNGQDAYDGKLVIEARVGPWRG